MSERDDQSDDELEGQLSRPGEERPPYVESTIIMTTVRVIAPFVLTLGLFVMFHGASSAGGGFQGGVIAATTVVMLGFAYGIEPIAAYLRNEQLAALVLGGLGTFLLVGFGSYAFGGTFLEFTLYPIHHGSKYSIELVELGIGVVVSGVITGLFFLLGTGLDSAYDATEPGEEDR
ncbi:multisubunit sodium/proton antiporter, MrpB subunit (TC 2.A.63.1) [Haloplanus vescus]|uniref:Multisubunit sodium/proton antiporter, MrpB subunit (TC 2.A.63.1) n=1 Tax=Haloplanus vescus TaxID=555874 RepID=A0A1H3W243_9EURY|nr:MnhB domain-containing protein [Haloplanus vescus]SDZ81109.1 multisubunit sodium/proton antiporter, MrpB subunit (TC 2.A.63.1) [Haloplanus vescus]